PGYCAAVDPPATRTGRTPSGTAALIAARHAARTSSSSVAAPCAMSGTITGACGQNTTEEITAARLTNRRRVESVSVTDWGRIDDDGTVYVRTADGERAIGSWQAGDRQAGLAFYTRRYEDLEAEVALLERRLESGAGEPGSSKANALSLKEQLPTAAAIGDLDALNVRLDALITACDEKTAAAAAARVEAREEAIGKKEALIAEA